MMEARPLQLAPAYEPALGVANWQEPTPPVPHAGWRYFMLLVLLPTFIVALYYALMAADQYESQAQFVIQGGSPLNGVPAAGGFLGIGSAMDTAANVTFSVIAYMKSHDAVQALGKELDLVNIFRRDEADLVSRLWWSQPTQEELDRYYRRRIDVDYDDSTGLTTLQVHVFRADDAHSIAEALLRLAEQRVNDMNMRRVDDTVRVARQEVAEAEHQIAEARQALTDFSIRERSIDPQKSVSSVLEVIAGLEDQLAQARAQRQAASFLKSDSPQSIAMRTRIDALQRQIDQQRARLTASNGSMAPVLSRYEQLVTTRDLAQSNYSSAMTAMDQARTAALKQQYFLSRSVQPNLPEEALYPRRFLNTFAVFLTLAVAYGIGWLILAGFREHLA